MNINSIHLFYRRTSNLQCSHWEVLNLSSNLTFSVIHINNAISLVERYSTHTHRYYITCYMWSADQSYLYHITYRTTPWSPHVTSLGWDVKSSNLEPDHGEILRFICSLCSIISNVFSSLDQGGPGTIFRRFHDLWEFITLDETLDWDYF